MATNEKHLELALRLDDTAGLLRRDLKMHNEADLLSGNADRLREGTIYVPVIGRASAGKTTLINALADVELPTSPNIIGGALVEIYYGDPSADAEIFYADGSAEKMQREAFNEFISLEFGNDANIRDDDPFPLPDRLQAVRYTRLSSNSPLSRAGITFVDTLGFDAGPLAANKTRDVFKQSDVVVMVLGTRPPFTQTDVSLLTDQLMQVNDDKARHIFIVLNDFSLRDDEKQSVLNHARKFLADFVNFDEQVFLLDAYETQELKRAGETGERLEATGYQAFLLTLEAQIESQSLLKTGMQRAAKRAVGSILAGQDRIETWKVSASSDVSAIEDQVTAAQKILRTSEQKRDNFLREFDLFALRLEDKFALHYQGFFLHHTGKQDWKQSVRQNFPKLKYWDLLKAIIPTKNRSKRQETLQNRIEPHIRKVVNGKVFEWQQALEKDLGSDSEIEKATKGFEVLAEDFTKSLDLADRCLVEVSVDTPDPTRQDENGKRVLQMLLGILTLDANQVVGTVIAPDWKSFIRRLAIDVGVILAAVFLFGPLGILVAILVSIVEFIVTHMFDKKAAFSHLVDRIANEIHINFSRRGVPVELKEAVRDKLAGPRGELKQTMDTEIDTRYQQYETLRTLENKEHVNVAAVTAHYAALDSTLIAQCEAISQLAFDKVYTAEELREMSRIEIQTDDA